MFVIGIVNAINISRSTIRKFVHFWCIFGVEAPEGSKVGHRTEYGDPISVQARDSVEAALQYERGKGFVTGFKPFFALGVPRERASSAALDGRKSMTDRRSSGIRHRFPRGTHTTHCRSQSVACWSFLNKDSQLRLPNFSFLRLRSGPPSFPQTP